MCVLSYLCFAVVSVFHLINLESLVILDMWFVTRLCNSAHMIRFNVLHGTTRMTLCAHLSLAI